MNPPPRFARVAVIGPGLLGGSFAGALKRRLLADRVVGFSSGADAGRALALGLIDERAASLEDAVAGADLVMLAAPVSINCALFERVVPRLAPGALLTDVSSVKAPVVAAARRALGARIVAFVPGHPIAGGERTGPDAADPDLFVGRSVVLSPLPESSPALTAVLAALWRAVGAQVAELTPEAHDRIYALVSHWPHALAFAVAAAVAVDGDGDGTGQGAGDVDGASDGAVVGAVADASEGGGDGGRSAAAFAGPGLLDMTRIAASSPALWADILLHNTAPALAAAARIDGWSARIAAALRAGDRDELIRLFEVGAAWRRSVAPRSADSPG
ncbi:MAG: prephenate dehydrogenase [Lautropia sp.]